MSLTSATISIQPNASPTVNTFLGLIKDVLPTGIYNGGGVSSGPGRSLSIQPFTVKSREGLTVTTSAVETIAVTTVLADTVFWLVLHVESWSPVNPINDGHYAQFKLVLDSSIDSDSDADYYIRFAQFTATTDALILNSNIDSSTGDRINLNSTANSKILYNGTDSFNGPDGKLVQHNLGTSNYSVNVTPTGRPQLGLGDIWVTKNSNAFTVFCSGRESINFDWQIMSALRASDSTDEGFSSIFVTGKYSGYSKIQFGAETVSTSALYSNPISITPKDLIYTTKELTTDSNDSWSLLVGSSALSTNPHISLRWKLLDKSSNTDLIIESIDGAGAAGYHTHMLRSLNYMAFLVPQFYTTKKPLITRNIDSVDFDFLEAGTYRLIIVKNIDKYIHGTMSGTGSMQAYHGISGNYVPLISFTSSDDDITEMSIIPSDNKFNTYIDTGVMATAEWLIL